MRVFVSVDMEGVSGLTDPEEMRTGGRGYDRGCELMTGDANAAVRGAFVAGADEVVVTDAHGSTKNLRADLIDERCTLIRGPYRPLRMGQGIGPSHDAAMFVGYHARAGVPHGVLNHTWMGYEIQNMYLNGEICGEIRLIAGLAGSMGVPVALVTGDEAACAEARELLGDVETVAVKKGIDRYSAELLPPGRAQSMIGEAAARALRSLDRLGPYEVPAPYTLGIDWASTSMAESCAMIPGVKRAGARSVEFTSDDYTEIMSVLGILATIGGSVGCTGAQYG
jgi:D-amino peptidase